MINNGQWFTEIAHEAGLAFSLQVKEKLHEEQSPYQKIEVYDTEHFGRLLVIDSYIMLTSRDNFIYHEMMSHPILNIHPNPERVLIIGGGDCGTLSEVLKHSQVVTAHQVDIDERVTRVCEQYFPELCISNSDTRVRLEFGDGIRWVRDCKPNSYDIIIVDSTDPVGPGEVLFTTEFYQLCLVALGNDGIIVQQSESPLIHYDKIIKPMITRLHQAGFANTKTLHFPQCCYPSGWWSCTLASVNCDLDSFRKPNASNIDTKYYTTDVHQAAGALPAFMCDTSDSA